MRGRSVAPLGSSAVVCHSQARKLSIPAACIARSCRSSSNRKAQDMCVRRERRPDTGAPHMTVSFIATLLIGTCSDGRSIAQEQRISSASEPLKVVSWNIHGCSSGIEGVIKQLRRLHPDLVCLQEAEASEDQDGVRQPQAIAKALGMREYSAGSRLPNGHEQRMAILFRGQIAKPEPLNAGTGRIYGVTGLMRLNGAEIRVVCLHLTSSYQTEIRHLSKTTAARSEESKHLVKLLGQWSTPVIVAGDFNSMSGMLDHDAITGRLRATPTTRPTFPSRSSTPGNRPHLRLTAPTHSESCDTAYRGL